MDRVNMDDLKPNERSRKERKKTHHYAYFVTCFAPHLLSKLYLQKGNYRIRRDR